MEVEINHRKRNKEKKNYMETKQHAGFPRWFSGKESA